MQCIVGEPAGCSVASMTTFDLLMVLSALPDNKTSQEQSNIKQNIQDSTRVTLTTKVLELIKYKNNTCKV